MKITRLLNLLLLLCLLSCTSEPVQLGNESADLVSPTIQELQNDGQTYHNMSLELTGSYISAFEMSVLFLDDTSNDDEAIWVDFSDDLTDIAPDDLMDKIQGKKLRVQGTFNALDGGHLGQYFGTIILDYIETID